MCSFIACNLACSSCMDKHIYVHIYLCYYSFSIRFRLRRKTLFSVSGVSLSEVRSSAERSGSPAGVSPDIHHSLIECHTNIVVSISKVIGDYLMI